jgi:hypothetical protein
VPVGKQFEAQKKPVMERHQEKHKEIKNVYCMIVPRFKITRKYILFISNISMKEKCYVCT